MSPQPLCYFPIPSDCLYSLTTHQKALLSAAQDRVGHVTEAWSEHVIIDKTPPSVGRLAAGTVTRENFVPGPELSVHWNSVADRESGVKRMEVWQALVSFVVLPFIFALVFLLLFILSCQGWGKGGVCSCVVYLIT